MRRLLVFASGSASGGGSGFEKLAQNLKAGQIVTVVSNHADGGVAERAQRLGIPFIHFPGPWTEAGYRAIAQIVRPDFTALSGWLKPVVGFDSHTTFNIHPGPLPDFGGKGMYGMHVHRKVLEAYHRGQLDHSEVCMHFVTAEYDEGPVIFRCRVPIVERDTPESLAARVNRAEHAYQPVITDMIMRGEITWNTHCITLTYDSV